MSYKIKHCEDCDTMLADVCGSLYCYTCNSFKEGKQESLSLKYRDIIDTTIDSDVSKHDYFSYGYHACNHNQNKVKLGAYTIWCSEAPGSDWKRQIPDLGIYMSDAWQDYISPVWSTGTKRGIDFGLSLYPAIILDWKDMDVPDFELLCRVVNYAVQNIKQGKQLEIGCFGGHGRTGTLLACIIVKIENISAENAIFQVRKMYCKQAIETKKQEDLIKKYAEYAK